jgi:uncharacterized protein YfaS (alpha-2-macroglobulin family)
MWLKGGRFMKKYLSFCFLISLLAGAVFFVSCGDGKETQLFDDPKLEAGELKLIGTEEFVKAPQQEEEGEDSLRIELIPCVRPGEEIRFRFSMPMAEKNALGSAPLPQITFYPELKGTFKWRSPKELVFTPAKGVVAQGQYISVDIANAVPLAGSRYALKGTWYGSFYVYNFQMAGKIAQWPVREGKPRFVALLNSLTGAVGQGPILLLYDQPVSVSSVGSKIKVYDASGKNLEVNIFKPDAEKINYISDLDARFIIGITISRLPGNGQSLHIEFPSWEEGGALTVMDHTLTVNRSFTLLESYFDRQTKNGRAPLDAALNLRFNNKFDLVALEQAIKITPQPKSIYITGYGYEMARIQMELEPGKEYRLYTEKMFHDVLGNPLEKGLTIDFKSQDLPPLLEVPAVPLVLESDKNKIPVKIRNVEDLKIKVVQFANVNYFIKALKETRKGSALEYGLKERGKVFQTKYSDYKSNLVQLFDVGIDNTVGLKCVEISGRGVGSEAESTISSTILIQSTNMAVTSKVFAGSVFTWVTALSDARPMEKALLAVYDENGKRLGAGISDSDGTAVIDVKEIGEAVNIQPLFVVATCKDDNALSRLKNEELSNAWQFGLPGIVEGSEDLHAAIFTERGVYRPGEEVHLKIMVKKGMISGARKIMLKINDPRGQQVVSAELALDAFNAADYDLTLKEQAPVGEYYIQVAYGNYRSTAKFQVEEYRVPTFIVTVTSQEKTWKLGQTVHAQVKAQYVHGSSLAGRRVDWRVFRQIEQFYVKDLPGFVFSMESDPSLTGFVTNGNGRLDGEGNFTLDFQPSHPSAAGCMLYSVEASVTDVDRQNYAGSVSKLVHPAQFYIGVKPPPKEVLIQGDELSVPVIVVDQSGTPLPGITVKATMERIDFHKTARMSDYGDVQVQNRTVPVVKEEKTIRSAKTAVICSFNLEEAGYYTIRFSATDSDKQPVESGFRFTVSGDNTVAWPRFDKEQVTVIADKKSYKPGEKAVLVVQSPYEKATGLLTIERNGILTHKLFYISNNTPALTVPIRGDYAPNVYVSVILVRGRVHHKKDASGFETGAPGFKIGYVNLEVTPLEQKLNLSVKPSVEKANPGQELTVDLFVKDYKNLPVAGQATIMVVDEAVLSLTAFCTPDPLLKIYSPFPLGIRTASSLLDLPHSRRSRREVLFPGGGGGPEEEAFFRADSTVLRKLFKSTAYWNPNVLLDKNGKARISFILPDNITTYRIMAVVTDKNSRLGSIDKKIICQKPLMIQPVLPRFIYPNDELQIEALVFNGTNRAEKVQLFAELEGLRFASGEAFQEANIQANSSQSFIFKVKAEKANKAIVRFKALSAKNSDAAQYELPVLEPGSQRVMVADKSVSGTDSIEITLPAERIAGSAHIEVVTSSTVLSELKDSVQYLMMYPNGCIEQTTSTAYPLVVLKDLLPEMGIDVSQEDLKKFSEAGVKRILSFQTESGGLSYWPGGTEPHAFATAFGLTALIEAKKRGYDVPDEALAGMADYLEESLRKGQITGEMPHGGMADADTRALFVMTLGRLGRPQPGYVSALWNKRSELTAFGLSFLAIAVKEMPGDQALLKPILAEIRRIAEEKTDEAYFSGEPKGGWSFDSPLRSQGGALIAYALANIDPEMSGKLLAGLLKRREYGLWGNTQENVFGIMGVHAIAANKAGGSAPLMELKINGKVIKEAAMEKTSSRVRRLSLTESDLGLIAGKPGNVQCTLSNKSGTPIFLTVRVRYDVPLNEKNRKPTSDGFTITRSYETLEGKSLEGKTIPLGSLVRVRLSIKSEGDHHYCAFDDKLPAGLEPLNVNLKTTEKVYQGELTATTQRSLSVLSYSEMRDHRVAFYVDELLKGDYEFTYVARATTPGTFLRPAGRAEAMYQPQICGTTAIDFVTIK